ncbi:MAG: hypothetical protein M3381_03630 [Actinomycetota bacterium]|nr:hypothetical protein [Actinomycetota bacterium]
MVKVLIAEELLYRASLDEVELGSSELSRMETMLMDSDMLRPPVCTASSAASLSSWRH